MLHGGLTFLRTTSVAFSPLSSGIGKFRPQIDGRIEYAGNRTNRAAYSFKLIISGVLSGEKIQ